MKIQKLKKLLATLVMCIGVFLVMLDTTIMNIALPAIQKSLNISTNKLSWTLNIYTIIFASFTIPLSRLGDLFGKNKMYLIGLILFGTGSLVSGISNNFDILIIGRISASLGEAILLPLANTIGISLWDVNKRFKIVAALGLTQGGAAAIGPTLGGFITDYTNWHWIFLINIPLVLISLFLCLFSLSIKYIKKNNVSIDWLGSITSMISLFLLTLGIIKGRDWDWFNNKIIFCFSFSIIFMIMFVIIERKSSFPMINLKLFKIKPFISSAIVGLLVQFFYIGVIVMMPTFFTRIQGKNELEAAMILLPMSIAVFCFGGLSSLLINKLGPRMIIFSGITSLAVSYYLISYLQSSYLINMSIATLVCGIGFGIVSGPVNVLAASNLKGELLNSSQSVITVFRQIGSVLGVAIFMSMLNSNMQNLKIKSLDNLTSTYLSMYKVWLPFLVASTLLSLLFVRKTKYLKQ